MYKPGQTVKMRAEELGAEIADYVWEAFENGAGELAIADAIAEHLEKILRHPECPKCGSEKVWGLCGHVWELK